MSTSSQLQAVHECLLSMVERLTAKLNERVLVGRVDMALEEIDTFARLARGQAYEAVDAAYRRGFEHGVRSAVPTVESEYVEPLPRPVRATREFEVKR